MAPSPLPDRAVLPVIHPQDEEQALRNIQVAIDAGAAGVFLVNNDILPEEAIKIFRAARAAFPEYWLGINLLGLEPHQALGLAFAHAIALGANGLQTDNARIADHDGPSPTASSLWTLKKEGAAGLVYFGGVAFKGQDTPLGLERAASNAAGLMDVVTTSGSSTGAPPAMGKVRTMREAIGPDAKLAVASGVSINNIEGLLTYVDYFLVGSSISPTWVDLDPGKTAELVAACR
jgi:predicted TIM-barrel enzyme